MNVVVTGSRGFIGTHLVARLRSAGNRVIGLDRLPVAHDDDIALDLLDGDALTGILAAFKPDRVFLLAGLNAEPRDPEGLQKVLAANILTVESAVAALTNSIGLATGGDGSWKPRVLLASSCAVYGIPAAADGRVAETDRAKPILKYGEAKLKAETVIKSAWAAGGFECVTARLFNVTGPGESPDFVVGSVARQALSGLRPVRVGDLSTVRDFIDVRDVASALDMVAERGRDGAVYNVGTGVPTVVGDRVKAVIAAAAPDTWLQFDPGRVKSADVAAIYADVSAISELGFKPAYSMERTIADIVAGIAASMNNGAGR